MSGSEPLVAFSIAAYNAGSTIGATLESLLAQTSPSWCAVVVDDGSDDGTVEIASAFASRDSRIAVRAQGRRGPAAARELGVSVSRSESVCFLDSDDLVDPVFVERVSEAIGNGADAVATGFRWIGPRGEDLRWSSVPSRRDTDPDVLLTHNALPIGSVCIRRACLEHIRERGPLFDQTRLCQDWDLLLALATMGIRWAPPVERALFSYRLREGSMIGDLRRLWEDGVRLIEDEAHQRMIAGPVVPELIRPWSLRCLARATVRGDGPLLREIGEKLISVGPEEAPMLRGALEWAYCLEHRIGPHDADAHSEAWREHAARALRSFKGAERIAATLSWGDGRWRTLARHVHGVAGESRRVVVYGAGRNGRAFAAAWANEGGTADSLRWIDDHPAADPPGERICVEDLSAADIVVVTPDDRAAILDALGQRFDGLVVTPDLHASRPARAG